MFKNEKGISLVEVLAALLISSIVAGIIYTMVILSMNYNNVEATKTSLQQEANYIVTEIQRIHRQCESYTLSITTDNVEIKDCIISRDGSVDNLNKIISNKYQYAPVLDKFVEPKKFNLRLCDFNVLDPNNKKLSVKIQTEFSRYIDGKQIEEPEECDNE